MYASMQYGYVAAGKPIQCIGLRGAYLGMGFSQIYKCYLPLCVDSTMYKVHRSLQLLTLQRLYYIMMRGKWAEERRVKSRGGTGDNDNDKKAILYSYSYPGLTMSLFD